MGQLGVEYWLENFKQRWGVPCKGLKLVLITDSQASLDIMAKMDTNCSLRGMLAPEMDVALELYSKRQQHDWVKWEFIKVESHIDILKAPDEFYWHCNDMVDKLATEARTAFTMDEMEHALSYVLPGAKVVCKINGQTANNHLYETLRNNINGRILTNYLIEKYAWNRTLYDQIAWKAHGRELNKMVSSKRITTIKYIHGWLVNGTRQYYTGRRVTRVCPLCSETDDRRHLFQCQNEVFLQLRGKRMQKLLTDITQGTAQGFKQVFGAGIQTVSWTKDPDTITILDWPQELQEAYEIQRQIGWDQVMYGQLVTHWESLAEYGAPTEDQERHLIWTGKAIRLCWDFGLDLWTTRNQLVVGTGTGLSREDVKKVNQLVTAVYQTLLPSLLDPPAAIFEQSESDTQRLPYGIKKAWLEKIRFLYPTEYTEIAESIVGKLETESEEELKKIRGVVSGPGQVQL